jgi:hypothetical protein
MESIHRHTALVLIMRTPGDSASAARRCGDRLWHHADRRGYTASRSTIAQGPRCGFSAALVSTVPTFLIYYAVEPKPRMLVIKQEIFSIIEMLLLGNLVAQLNPRTSVSA